MGEHKIPGASLGDTYRKHQTKFVMAQHTVVIHSASYYGKGNWFRMQDGQCYGVTEAGNFIKIADPKLGGSSGN